MAKPDQPSQTAASPTLPLPPPREAASISLDQFVEAVSVSALRALSSAAALNPQPLPPKQFPKPWIWVGIVASFADLSNIAGGGGPGGPAIGGGGVG